MRKNYVRRSDVTLLVDLTDRIKEEMGMDLAEAAHVVHACLPTAMCEAEVWILPARGESPYLSDSEPSELISRYISSKWWLYRRAPIDPLQGGGPVDEIREMGLLQLDAEELVRRVHEYVGDPTQIPDLRHGYMNPLHPRYAPKLAAAVRAWQAVDDEGKTSPKQALEGWLRAHADDFGLTNAAVEECSKVANWKAQGRAPKTPSA
ncbi:hypothetical protein [Variovorax sp. J22R115]|uniref:hypothetical protein n=1 Tax=Variovorax sp. J22R115 TaxID=3053509 RepID=UPI002576CE66|nr:hypothetical protein [Variovorax sp. J22R115]MDM0051416.1 hypothetical protein [Variovorax sp. J22R115]